jgi:hypothetical protein
MSTSKRNTTKCCNSELSCKATAELQQEIDKDLAAPDKSLGLLLEAKLKEMDNDVNEDDQTTETQDD